MDPKAGTSTDTDVVVKPALPPLIKYAIYPPDDKALKILGLLDASRREGEFCDVQLKLSANKTVFAHKALLAACSPYFEGMFTSTFLEATSEVVDLSHITEHSDILEKVINTFYGHRFEINEMNVGETLNLATMLLLDDLKILCASVIEGVVNVRNAADVLHMSINFDLKELQKRVVPILKSRFHDYIMFQEELLELGAKPFGFLLSQVDTNFISREVDFLNLLLKWFNFCETDERANLLVSTIQQITFPITGKIYREIESDVTDIILHLDDVNSDVSEETGQKLQASLSSLKPQNYSQKEVSSESEMEDEPVHEYYVVPGARFTVSGPKTEKDGYTEEEKKIWERAEKDMIKRNQHRIWAKQWPPDLLNTLGTHDDPNRPKKIMREGAPEIHRSRKFKVKTAAELLEESNLVNVVVVLAPSTDFIERRKMKKAEDGTSDDIMEICAYVPRKKTWYKLGSVYASSIQNSGGSHPRILVRKPGRAGHGDDDEGPDDDEDEEMMDMYAHNIPELMMMRDMPSRYRRRLMEQSMPPGMLRRMMREMDMDEDNMPPHAYMMMMREASKMRRFMGGSGRKVSLPSLSDPKWKMVYLRQQLFFYHQDFCESVFCYDLLQQKWLESGFNVVSGHPGGRGSPEVVDGIDLIVMGQTLYAVVRFCIFDMRRDYYSRQEEKEKKTQEVQTFFKVFRMSKENNSWEMACKTQEHHSYIQVDKPFDPERHRHSFMDYHDIIPFMRQPGALKTVLYAEDDEKLNIFLLRRQCDRDTNNVTVYKFSQVDIIYFDLNDHDSLIDTPYRQEYLREPIPLFNDSLVVLLNDELEGDVKYDRVTPGRQRLMTEYGNGKPEKTSEFLEGLNHYPMCPTILTRDRDTLWIMRGAENNTSEMIEVTVSCCYKSRRHRVNKTPHPPPPFRLFSLATTGKIDRTLLRTLNPPTKYLHA